MSDWKFLEYHRVTKPREGVDSRYCSTSLDGFNGMFRFMVGNKPIRVIASDGEGWQHVSVSIEGDKRCPSWEVMCEIKDLFWNQEDWVAQFHPAKSQYVNNHPGCLHLWRPTEAVLPTPKAYMVGIKT
jgi:hypothetical protein